MLRETENTVFRQSHTALTPPPIVGPQWPQRFLQRHPEYFKRKQKPLSTERKNAHQPAEIQAHFDAYNKVKEENGILDADIWNFDETGFRIGVGRAQWIITKEEHRRLYAADPGNRESVTAVEAISGAGVIIPAMLILSAAQFLKKWFLENDLISQTTIAVSDSGYSNDDISLDWLEHLTSMQNLLVSIECSLWTVMEVIHTRNLLSAV